MSTYCESSDSIRLIYPKEEDSRGFELELLFAKNELSSHINLFLYPLPFLKQTEYPLTLTCEDETYTYAAYLHKGGQKLTLSKEAQECLLSLLKKGEPIQLSFKGHSQMIHGKGFKKYEKFIRK
ncbi:MAG: hypothetical protein KBC64_03360 [Simkaniaceae bacterium]|nr:hypothetical protein [Simkaniaceae bacterium]